jgi:hypothetical protein
MSSEGTDTFRTERYRTPLPQPRIREYIGSFIGGRVHPRRGAAQDRVYSILSQARCEVSVYLCCELAWEKLYVQSEEKS